MVFSDLFFNMKQDFPERTIYLEATTRGDNKVKKEIFVGVKKACTFNVANLIQEVVFDHGHAGNTYGLTNMVTAISAATANVAEGSTY